MILTSFYLLASTGFAGVGTSASDGYRALGARVTVLGEGRLRFSTGHAVAFASAVTLRPNAVGRLADTAGRAVLPEIRVTGPFAVSMNGTVRVSGRAVGRLVLQTKGGEVGFPGEGTFGVLQVENSDRGVGSDVAKPVAPLRTPHSALTTIAVRPRTEVVGDRVLLRDVADLSGDRDTVARLREIDLGETPALGSRRNLTRWSLQAVLRNAGIMDASVQIDLPLDATVARKGQTVEVQAILDAASEEAKKSFGNAELTVIGMGPSPVVAPSGSLTLVATSARNGEKASVTVRVRVDDRPAGERTVVFSAKLDRVQSGEAVRIRVERNGAVLETDGKAKTAGYVGDTIQVTTLDGATMTATVTAVGQVEVRL